jgi:hypothetical protein
MEKPNFRFFIGGFILVVLIIAAIASEDDSGLIPISEIFSNENSSLITGAGSPPLFIPASCAAGEVRCDLFSVNRCTRFKGQTGFVSGFPNCAAIPGPNLVCQEGRCQSLSQLICSDSDITPIFTDGINLDEKGVTCQDGGSCGFDFCNPFFDPILGIHEFYCDGDTLTFINELCDPGEICVNGACASSGCTDSDGGAITTAIGRTCDTENCTFDSCVDSVTINESFCSGVQRDYTELACPPGFACSNGACDDVQCTDTDGGFNPLVSGTACDSSTSTCKADSCLPFNLLNESFCDAGVVVTAATSCTAEELCSGGACTKKCTDTDGFNISQQGTLCDSFSTFCPVTDFCVDSTTVREFTCDITGTANPGTFINITNVPCPSGSCVNGVCVPIQRFKIENMTSVTFSNLNNVFREAYFDLNANPTNYSDPNHVWFTRNSTLDQFAPDIRFLGQFQFLPLDDVFSVKVTALSSPATVFSSTGHFWPNMTVISLYKNGLLAATFTQVNVNSISTQVRSVISAVDLFDSTFEFIQSKSIAGSSPRLVVDIGPSGLTPVIFTCSDTDGTPQNFAEQGTACNTIDCLTDSCLSGTTLREYMCENGDRVIIDFDCTILSQSCSSGKCQ